MTSLAVQASETLMYQPTKVASVLSWKPLSILYAVFCLVIYGVYDVVAKRHFSSILTVAVIVELLSFVVLGVQAQSRQSTAGISRKMLILYAVGLCVKLSSTLFFGGYLPVDPTGDFIFQAADVGSLAIVLWLLFGSCSESAPVTDDLPIKHVFAGCFLLAVLTHGNMNRTPLFDTLWLMGVLVDQIAVVPQIWLITRCGGRVEGIVSHHMAAIVVSRACSFFFFWEAWEDITSDPYRHFPGVQHCIWTITLAHFLHFILVVDFGCFYVRNILKNGVGKASNIRTN